MGACPGTTMICNHVGYPLGVGPYADKSYREEMFQHWKKDIAELANCSNVYMKVGGTAQACCMMGEPVPWCDLKRELPPSSQEISDAGSMVPPLRGLFRTAALHVRDKLASRQSLVQLHKLLERIQDHVQRLQLTRQGFALSRHRCARVQS